MREVQIKEIVREIVRESFKQSISEETYQFGKKSYTDKKLTPSEILDLANAYVNEPTTKLAGKSLGHRIYVANDLARLTGTIQLDVRIRSKQPALIVQLLKTGLLTKDEYVKLYTKLIEVQAEYIKTYLKKAAPEKRNQGAAMRAAAKDGKDDFSFENVNEMGQNDIHFKNILRAFDHGGSFTKKKVAVAVCKNPNANRNKIIDYLKDMDYNEILQVEDELNIGESVNEGKPNYEVYHKTYTSAIQAALDYAKKEGYDYDEEETAREIGMGPRKPSEGKTNKFHLSLKKNFKEQKKMLHIQVYGMKNSYELNAYIQ